jgi:DNA mismatch endonuclease (patch repair protein)
MTDVFDAAKRSEVMSRIRSINTQPELALRRALHAAGFRYRLHVRELPGKPDIVLARYDAVIQVRGCFWHLHTCKLARVPKSRLEYWVPKLANNKRRDAKNDRILRKLGWHVITVWECQLKTSHGLERQVRRIVKLLDRSS